MHASGIRVDEAAQSSFASACNDPSTLFLQYRIQNECFTRVGSGRTRDSLDANWAEIQSALSASASEPSFVVARGVSRDPARWLLLFYMPEGCTVRDRMVYAASASALKDGLGSAHFDAATFNISKASEATAAEYTAVSRNMSADELLTLDEKLKLEGESESAKSMSSTRARAIVGLPIQASEGALAALSGVAAGQPSSAVLLLDVDSEELRVEHQGHFSFEQLAAKLPANEPRYLLSHFTHEHDGASKTAFVFFYYCPDDAKAKQKMFYSTCKSVVMKVCENVGMSSVKSIETSDAKEVSTAAVLESLYPVVAAVKTFKKPARPGRGNARLISSPDAAASSASPSP